MSIATLPEANWSKSSFCSVKFRFRPPNDLGCKSGGFKVPSMTKSE